MIDLIKKVSAREIIDSRGQPTVEVEIKTERTSAVASVPSGKSRGKNECVELRDNDPRRFGGMGVLKAVNTINNEIRRAIRGMNVFDFEKIDEKMIALDGTEDKSRLGGNSILAVSVATVRAASQSARKELFDFLGNKESYSMPVPMMNLINGGKHAGNKLSIQEFLIIPSGAKNVSEAIRAGCEIYESLKQILMKNYGKSATNVGDEGGFAPPFEKTEQALDSLCKAVQEAGYENEVKIGLDVASTSFYLSGKYEIDGYKLSREKMIDYLLSIVKRYNIASLEDPLYEEDFEGFSLLRSEVSGKAVVIGDDLLCTNIKRIRLALQKKSVDAVLIKPNQIGSVTETIKAIKYSHRNKLITVVSHRSGETNDSFISHLSVAFGSLMIKAGAPARGERVSKYNELMRISSVLGKKCSFSGKLIR